jgi:cytidine deaminase
MFAASSQYPGIPFKAIAVTASSENFVVDYPVSPCGSCRQVMAEYENSRKAPIRVILKGESGKVIVFDKSNDLLPFVFNSDQLKSK